MLRRLHGERYMCPIQILHLENSFLLRARRDCRIEIGIKEKVTTYPFPDLENF